MFAIRFDKLNSNTVKVDKLTAAKVKTVKMT